MGRYERYKDSGIDWIGEIPAGWATCSLKQATKLVRGAGIKREEVVEGGEPCVRYGELYTTYHGAIRRAVSCVSGDLWASSVKCAPFDLVIALTGETKEDIGPTAVNLTGCELAVGGDAAVIRPLLADGQYLAYALNSEYMASQKALDATGDIIVHLGVEKLGRERLVLPPLDEQRAIADYLDTKTAEIDALITDCEREVELLQEYRKSVISEAVTRGLDPDAPMKDSGIDWIGEISAGWKVTRFKYVGRVAANLQPPSDYQDKMHVAPENIEKDTGRLLSCSTVCIDGVESDNHLFKAGVVLYSKVRPALNKVTVAPFSGLCSADMYPIDTQNDSKWLMYYMLSSAFSRQVIVSTDRVKMPKINKEELGAFWVLLPPLDEQRAIADYLDEKTSQIDGLIDAKRQMAEKLREYRKSLISEAVTGKFKVPGI